ncbi:MAG: DUF4145 domain-containing protein, partial [Desulfovibrionaceae bacterium]|nr:DUF4145 domain-containing protein [Desulfovibrionaceae bacterium]
GREKAACRCLNGPAGSAGTDSPGGRLYAAGLCRACQGPVLLEIAAADRGADVLRARVQDRERLYDDICPDIVRMWPEGAAPYSCPAVPAGVRELFADLQTMLAHKMFPPLVIAGCRSVLDGAAAALGAGSGPLSKRMAQLKNRGIVRGPLWDWSQQIRMDGNEAVHNLRGTREEAEEIVEFTRVFLQYTFEFPDRMARFRNRRKGPDAAEASPPSDAPGPADRPADAAPGTVSAGAAAEEAAQAPAKSADSRTDRAQPAAAAAEAPSAGQGGSAEPEQEADESGVLSGDLVQVLRSLQERLAANFPEPGADRTGQAEGTPGKPRPAPVVLRRAGQKAARPGSPDASDSSDSAGSHASSGSAGE